ncbi:unnamed protein product, partial [Strongylus vulgaris]
TWADFFQAYAAFITNTKKNLPIATGNWGCGGHGGGNKELKSLIQILAAAKAGKDLIYYTFNDPKLEKSLIEQYEKMVDMHATIGQIYGALLSYSKRREKSPSLTVFEHVLHELV